MWFWFAFVLPVAGIWTAFHLGFDQAGQWLRAIYVIICSIGILGKIEALVRGFIGRNARSPNPKLQPLQLWGQMYKVWRLLMGPVVNPSMVRDAMKSAASQGAVWDNPSWLIIDRVISIISVLGSRARSLVIIRTRNWSATTLCVAKLPFQGRIIPLNTLDAIFCSALSNMLFGPVTAHMVDKNSSGKQEHPSSVPHHRL